MSAGMTNAIPTGGGGLKVIASGTDIEASGSENISLETGVQIVILTTVNDNNYAASALLVANGLQTIIVEHSLSGSASIVGTATLSANGEQLSLEFSRSRTINYLALG